MSIESPLSNLSKEILEEMKLEADEEILWTGKPAAMGHVQSKKIQAERKGIFLLGFLVTLPMSGSVLIQHFTDPYAWFVAMILLVSPNIVFAIALLLQGYWDRSKAKKTIYLITKKRALVVEPFRVHEFKTGKAGLFLDRVTIESGLTDLVLDRYELPGYKYGGGKKVIGFKNITDGEADGEADIAEKLLVQVLELPTVRHVEAAEG